MVYPVFCALLHEKQLHCLYKKVFLSILITGMYGLT